MSLSHDELRRHLSDLAHGLADAVAAAGMEDMDYLRGVHDGQHGRIDADDIDFTDPSTSGERRYRHSHATEDDGPTEASK